MPAREIPTPIELLPGEAEDLSRAAFVDGDAADFALAHRALYAIYAEMVWRAPNVPGEKTRLRLVRESLERGFRAQLDRRRQELAKALELPDRITGQWFEELALGTHPAESGEWGMFVAEHASLDQLRRIVAQRSLFFLREPDPWIYAVPTLSGVAKAGLIDLLLDEYGWGKLERMHSSIYAKAMESLGLVSERDHYEIDASPEYLATLNHQWMCALDGSLSRRLIGTIYLTEADSPGAMGNYLAAWERLGVADPDVIEFYALHVEADENHRAVALDEVVLPICEAEGAETAREIGRGIFDARMLEADFAASEMRAARVPA